MTKEEKLAIFEETKGKVKEMSIIDISDDLLALCLQIIHDERFQYELEPSNADNDKRIFLKTNIDRRCLIHTNSSNPMFSSNEMLETLGGETNGANIFTDTKQNMFRIMCYPPSMFMCDGCKESECFGIILLVLIVLKEAGILEEKLAERKRSVGFFKFEWDPPGGLQNVPEDIFQAAKKILDNNGVHLHPRLNENGFMKIATSSNCSNVKFTNEEWLDEHIKTACNQGKFFGHIQRDPTRPLDYICTNVACRLSHCMYMVAAYLYYLDKTNQTHKIDEDRAYYHEHEEEILARENAKLQNKIDGYLASQIDENVLAKFDPLKKHVENIDLLAHAISNKNRTNICFAIEREDGVDEKETIAIIEDALRTIGKIKDTKTEKEKEAVLRVSLSTFSDISGTSRGLIENKLYVISEIFGYVKEKHNVVSIEKLVDCLCSTHKNQYILAVGTHDELYGPKGLFAIDPKIKYVYDHFKISIRNLKIDELYDIYKKNLDPIVLDKLVVDEVKAREKFNDFVINNRSIFPFKNEEFAKYLARYSNSCSGLVFPPYAYKFQTLDESLQSIVGLESVKKKMKELEKHILFTNKSKAMGAQVPPTNLHMLFTGNPGTGKTVMARIMTRMLYDIGAIKENKLIEAERKDLIAEFIGQTAPKTAEVISKAMGGVLFIDEAYSLVPKDSFRDFGAEAIATLIKAMEDHKGEFVVILAGYEDEMRHFVNSNPGIASRIGYTFNFHDYSTEELLEIFKKKLTSSGFSFTDDFIAGATELIRIGGKRKNFGNGRFVDRLMQEVLMKHSRNALETNDILTITINDLPTLEQLNGESAPRGNVQSALDKIIGMEELKVKIRDFMDYVDFSKRATSIGLDIPNVNMHMLFTGNPGTGKTMTARIMTKMLYDIGVIHENKLVETSYEDFAGSYAGEPAKNTADIIDKAMGGVLFIDEAYSLISSRWASSEIIPALIKAMEDKKGEFIVIFAGYKNEMKYFVDSNPGIASRIGYTFHFADYKPEELLQIFQLKMKNTGFTLTEEANEAALKIMKYFGRVDNIGNGRFVDRVIQNTIMKHARQKNEDLATITGSAIPTVDETIKTLSNASSLLQPELVSEESMRKTAIHEIGHAYLRYKLYKDPQIVKITINAEGCGTLGYVQFENDHKATHSKTDLNNKIQVLLAGMGSEEIFNGEFENGNCSDLETATNIAKNMVMNYGMSRVGIGKIGNEPNLAVMVQNEANHILNECYKKVTEIIKANQEEMSRLVEYLLVHKELTGEEFLAVIEGRNEK